MAFCAFWLHSCFTVPVSWHGVSPRRHPYITSNHQKVILSWPKSGAIIKKNLQVYSSSPGCRWNAPHDAIFVGTLQVVIYTTRWCKWQTTRHGFRGSSHGGSSAAAAREAAASACDCCFEFAQMMRMTTTWRMMKWDTTKTLLKTSHTIQSQRAIYEHICTSQKGFYHLIVIAYNYHFCTSHGHLCCCLLLLLLLGHHWTPTTRACAWVSSALWASKTAVCRKRAKILIYGNHGFKGKCICKLISF